MTPKWPVAVYCSNLPNDQDMIAALGPSVVSMPLFSDCVFATVDRKLVAVERKKVGDLAQCVLTGRLLFQLQVSRENGADYLVIIIEGRYRRSCEDGALEIPVWGINPRTLRRAELWTQVRPAMQFSRFDQYLTELQRDAGVIIKHTLDVRGTADTIMSLYQNFQTPVDRHQSLKRLFKPAPPTVQLVRPSLVRRVACELPGIGWGRSRVVAEHFPNIKAMVDAGVGEWCSLDGIGRKTARSVVEAIRGAKRG